jgi:hypothetical protein
MPLRLKQRTGSLQLMSVTMTLPAPAATQWRTISATTSGLVFAACSGRRSQPILGLTTTTSPRETKVSIPPRAAITTEVSAAASASPPDNQFRRQTRDTKVAHNGRLVDSVEGTAFRFVKHPSHGAGSSGKAGGLAGADDEFSS